MDMTARRAYHDTSINELAASVRQEGLLQPLCIRPNGSRYELVFGVRRLRAARQAGLREVPCTIRVADDDGAFLLNVVENLHREHLSVTERVAAIERLAATGLGVREISRRTGFHPSTISRWLRINGRPELKQALEDGRIDIARAVILVEAPRSALGTLIEQATRLSTAELRHHVASLKRGVHGTRLDADDRHYLQRALRCLRAVGSTDERELIECIRQELVRLARSVRLATGQRLADGGGVQSGAGRARGAGRTLL